MDPTLGLPHNLDLFFRRCDNLIVAKMVTHVGIERVHVSWNVNTIRLLAYFEAIAMYAAEQMQCRVEQLAVTSARKRVLGSGKLSKAETAEKIKAMYTGLSLTDDECDAILIALAVKP
jgi:Holliday junction resolvasome RuvABC endonuclease subunit